MEVSCCFVRVSWAATRSLYVSKFLTRASNELAVRGPNNARGLVCLSRRNEMARLLSVPHHESARANKHLLKLVPPRRACKGERERERETSKEQKIASEPWKFSCLLSSSTAS